MSKPSSPVLEIPVGAPVPVPVWAVYTTNDEWARSQDLVGYFTREADAETAAEKRGWYGGKGEIRKTWALVIEPTLGQPDRLYYILSEPGPVKINVDLLRDAVELLKQAKEKARTQFSKAEREALGIKLDD